MYHIKHTAAEVIGNPIANVQGIVCHFKYSATMEIKNAMFVANVKNKKRFSAKSFTLRKHNVKNGKIFSFISFPSFFIIVSP